MAEPFTAVAAVSAALVYISRTAYELSVKAKNGKDEDRKQCKADVISSALQSSMDAQTELLKDIKSSQQDVRDGVKELVSIARRNTER